MNIWGWVHKKYNELREDGHERLAMLMWQLPTVVCADQHDEAEAMAAEAVDLAVRANEPWVEIFVRHWRAQSQILTRRDLSKGLFEVMSLFELAHREDNVACPQSVCVTQDICNAYSVIDGPGYGLERIAAASETLARINPKWPCYSCVSGEYLSALMDLRRFPEAKDLALKRIADISAQGESTNAERLGLAEARLALGEPAQALADLDCRLPGTVSKHLFDRQIILRRLAYCQLGQNERALKAHVPATRVAAADCVLWAKAELALIYCGAKPVRKKLLSQLRTMRSVAQQSNALFDQVELSLALIEITRLQQDSQAEAELIAELASLRTQLRRPEFLDLALAEMGERSQANQLPIGREETL